MPFFLCVTCGTQYAESTEPPSVCRICTDERQYIGLQGQHWTTLDAMSEAYENHIEEVVPDLFGVETRPAFAIGERALVVRHPAGNVLWDCISLVDQQTVDRIVDLGGLSAIAISHPHFYSSMIEWSHAFDGVPVYLHEADAAWVCRPDPCITFWSGETRLVSDGLTLVRCGGHFEGSTVLHWAAGAGGAGALLTGDTVKVGWDRQSVSVMRSYPNLIPVGAAEIAGVERALAPWSFEDVHGAWSGHSVRGGGRRVVHESLQRYLRAITGGKEQKA
jgi:hypothetical protein